MTGIGGDYNLVDRIRMWKRKTKGKRRLNIENWERSEDLGKVN